HHPRRCLLLRYRNQPRQPRLHPHSGQRADPSSRLPCVKLPRNHIHSPADPVGSSNPRGMSWPFLLRRHQSMKKIYIKTFGCQMNEYDSDKMVDVLGSGEGMIKTENPEEADIILFNTCSVREKAQEKVFSDLGRIRPLKEKVTPSS
uniref:MTTase N-terminal domain-containing protein n=1 Tax=Hucho hucho TaxID=62062 RepID=A0A4W5LUZ7_9TELE